MKNRHVIGLFAGNLHTFVILFGALIAFTAAVPAGLGGAYFAVAALAAAMFFVALTLVR